MQLWRCLYKAIGLGNFALFTQLFSIPNDAIVWSLKAGKTKMLLSIGNHTKFATLNIFWRQLGEIYRYGYELLTFFCGFLMNSQRFLIYIYREEIENLGVKSFSYRYSSGLISYRVFESLISRQTSYPSRFPALPLFLVKFLKCRVNQRNCRTKCELPCKGWAKLAR